MIQIGPFEFCESCEEGTGYNTAYGYHLPTVSHPLHPPPQRINEDDRSPRRTDPSPRAAS